MVNNLTYKTFGAKAILIEWQAIIDDKILKDILLFKDKITSNQTIACVDIIQGYNSLTLIFEDVVTDFNTQVGVLKSIYASKLITKNQQYYQWQIPVCYDVTFGIDLKEMSEKSNLEISEIIKLHTNTDYTIYFIGFLPGFLYLGGLHQHLFFDRKPNPRLKVPKGSVGIGGLDKLRQNIDAGRKSNHYDHPPLKALDQQELESIEGLWGYEG